MGYAHPEAFFVTNDEGQVYATFDGVSGQCVAQPSDENWEVPASTLHATYPPGRRVRWQ